MSPHAFRILALVILLVTLVHSKSGTKQPSRTSKNDVVGARSNPWQAILLPRKAKDKVKKDLADAKAKELDSFRVSPKNYSINRYEIDYNDNLIRLIENFLLRHMKKLIENQMRNKPPLPPLSATSIPPLSQAELNELEKAKIQAYEYNRQYMASTTTTVTSSNLITSSSTTPIKETGFTVLVPFRTKPMLRPTSYHRKRRRTTTKKMIPTSFDWYDTGGDWMTEKPFKAVYQLIASSAKPNSPQISGKDDENSHISSYDCDYNFLTGKNFTCKPRTRTTTTTTRTTSKLSTAHNISFNYSETLIPWNESNVFDLVIPLNSNETDNGFKEVESEYASYYKNYFIYFLSLIIFLSTLCLIFLIIIFISCVINCKQRSRLSYFNENEFFTYYNKNIPVIASVSSFSLTTPMKIKRSFSSNYETTKTAPDAPSKATSNDLLMPAPQNDNNNNNANQASENQTTAAVNVDHKLSTHLFGNKSSLTLYNQQTASVEPTSLPPLPVSNAENGAAKKNAGSGKLFYTNTVHYPSANKTYGESNSRSSSFRIMNKCQPKFMNLDGLHSTSSSKPVKEDLITTLSKNLIEASKNSEMKHLCRQLSNENLHCQHLNFIAGIRSSDPVPPTKMSLLSANNSINRTLMHQRKQQQQLSTDVYQSYPMVTPCRQEDEDDDDEDIVLENDINDVLMNNYPPAVFNNAINNNCPGSNFLSNLPASHSFRLSAYNRSSTLKDDEMAMAGVQMIDSISNNHINVTKSNSTCKSKPNKLSKSHSKHQNSFNLSRLNPLANGKSKLFKGEDKSSEVHLKSANMISSATDHQNEACPMNNATPAFIRDRYYQILREQVFPFLQRPVNNNNVNGYGHHYPSSNLNGPYPGGPSMNAYNQASTSSNTHQIIKESQAYTNDVLY